MVLLTPENLPEVITYFREARGWTMDELTKRAHVSQGIVNRIERGLSKHPDWSNVMGILSALELHVSVSYRKDPEDVRTES